jgi:hypothetical protein
MPVDRRCKDSNNNTKIEDALKQIAEFSTGCQMHGGEDNPEHCVTDGFQGEQIPKSILNASDRAMGYHDALQGAYAKQEVPSPEQEDTLVKWCELRASMCVPWTPADLRALAEAILGRPFLNPNSIPRRVQRGIS